MAAVDYDRWLKDAATWAQKDDWDTDEYFKWVRRLGEAKAKLDDTYLSVNKSLLEAATKRAGAVSTELQKAGHRDRGSKLSTHSATPIYKQCGCPLDLMHHRVNYTPATRNACMTLE